MTPNQVGMMSSKEADKSYKKLVKFLWKKPRLKGLGFTYNDLDKVVYMAERYLKLMEEMGV
jgi:hypothetical protein